MSRVVCWIVGHRWRFYKPVNAKFYDYWECHRCGARQEQP